MSISPVSTKIAVPPRNPGTLHRARLIDFVHEHIDRRLITISAPAGYGKTTLLVDFAHECDLAVCWYTLDHTDRDPQVFVEHVRASIAKTFPGFGATTQHVTSANPAPRHNPAEIAGLLVNEMVSQIPEWFVLILDDLHALENAPGVTEILQAILRYQPEHLRIITSSRAVPTWLPLIRLASQGEVAGLTMEDLRFAPSEIQKLLLTMYGTSISYSEAQELAEASEGWITSILLSTQHLHNGILDTLTRAKMSSKPIFDYLANEVLEHQDAALRDFLLYSSTLEEMTPQLCVDALGLADASHLLHKLLTRNLFVSYASEDRSSYRYHTLFRDFLQTRLETESPARFRQLHQRVADWFRQNNDPEPAARHCLVTGELGKAAQIINRGAQMLLRSGRREMLIAWVNKFPEEILATTPALAVCAAEAAATSGRVGQALKLIDLVQANIETHGEHESLAQGLAIKARIHYNRGRYAEALEIAEDALGILPLEADSHCAARAEVLRIQGMCLLRMGNLEEAESQLRTSLREGQDSEDDHCQVLAGQGLATCLEGQGKLSEAAEIQLSAANRCRQLGNPALLAEALNDMACHLFHVSGEYSAALAMISEALQIAREIRHRLVEAYALVSRGEMLRDLGDTNGAIESLEAGLEIAAQLENTYLTAYGKEAAALAYLGAGNSHRAYELAKEAVELAREMGFQCQADRHDSTLGLILADRGETEASLAILKRTTKRLARTKAKYEYARAQLFLAYALHRGKNEQAVRTLDQALSACLGTELEHRLLIESWPLASFLEYAAAQVDKVHHLSLVMPKREMILVRAREALSSVAAASVDHRPSIRVYSLGFSRVVLDETPISNGEWPSSTARHLLTYLLVNQPRTREQIGADLWPDLQRKRLSGTFNNTKYRLQKTLGTNPIIYHDQVYSIDSSQDIWHDVNEFEELVARAEMAPPFKAARYRQKAVDMYNGDFVEESYHDWCVTRREELRRKYLETVNQLVDWFLSKGKPEKAIKILIQGLQADNLREDLHRKLMAAYTLAGKPEEAIAQYRCCADILERELGLIPESATTELFNAVREGRLVPPHHKSSF